MDWVNKEQLEHFYWEKFWIATVSPAAVLTKVLEKNKENAWPLPQQSHLDHSGGGRGAFTVPSTVRMRSHVLFKWWEIRRPGCWADLDTSQTSSLLPHWTHRLQGKTPPHKITVSEADMLISVFIFYPYRCGSYAARFDGRHTCSCISWRCWWNRSLPPRSWDWSKPTGVKAASLQVLNFQ